MSSLLPVVAASHNGTRSLCLVHSFPQLGSCAWARNSAMAADVSADLEARPCAL